jgi:hypothetical protein
VKASTAGDLGRRGAEGVGRVAMVRNLCLALLKEFTAGVQGTPGH